MFPYLKANPVIVKARLLVGAKDNVVSTVNNGYKQNSKLRDKTGAGMLDAEETVYLSTNYLPAGYGYTQLSSLSAGSTVTAATPYLNNINKVRIVMVFDKPDTNIITSRADVDDIDIYLKDSNGNIVASSTAYNNVEVIECFLEKPGNYKIEVKRFARSGSNIGTPKVGIVWEY